ncbi:MAG: adenylate/guanylate cyclase domain-containing protein, partial [Candidatus Riflebacteria bacterium]|nr:adenylate/guanylate cyclase domain-containing protein [Candidatus Riflebacteria bacterium]
MAFWGAPLPTPDHARRGCRAGLAMLARLALLNERLAARGVASLEMGIGVNSGPAIVGTVGSEERVEYTLLGDAVNVASRLQELTKVYGRPLVMGETTSRAVAGAMATRRLDRARVRGRQEPLFVYEASSRPDAWAPVYEEGLSAYVDGRFEEACSLFERAARESPGDPAAPMMLERARRLSADPPEGWDGCWRW